MDRLKLKKMIRIRSLEKGIPLIRIAEEAGVSRQAIYNVVNGHNGSKTLQRLICLRLGFKPRELDWPEDLVA